MRIPSVLLVVSALLVFTLRATAGEEFLRLEKTIGNLDFFDRHKFDDPGLGYSLRYQNAGTLKADVYVYNMDINNLVDGIDSAEIRQEMNNVKRAIELTEQNGKYRNVKELENGVRKFDGLATQFLWSRFSYEQTDDQGVLFSGPRISDTFLVIARGQFVKIRITAMKEKLEKDGPQIDLFVRAVAEQVEKAMKP